MAQKEKNEQVTVNFPADMTAALKREAERQHRTLSGQIRHLVATAFQQQEGAAA
jgi:hypothetical protein